ncbi:hypothetical protein ACFPJ4_10565 [Lysinimonas soli]|uniref:Rho termination factor N-terminal domain-containing protein n=1 Tax=Lysinimonas soli TaxID=1074233 RepID=A0ABW0NQN1_9MICO
MASTKRSKKADPVAVPKLSKKKRAKAEAELAAAAKKAKKAAAKAKEQAKKEAAKAKELAKKAATKAKERAKKDAAKAEDAAKKDATKAKEAAKKTISKAKDRAKTVAEAVAGEPASNVDSAPAPTEETYATLRARARELRIPNYSRMSKVELQRRIADRG